MCEFGSFTVAGAIWRGIRAVTQERYNEEDENSDIPGAAVGHVGGARFTMDAANDLAAPGIIDDITYGLIYQGIMGLGVEVTETALVTLDFRYIVSDNVGFGDVAGTAFKVDTIQATAMFGLRTTF